MMLHQSAVALLPLTLLLSCGGLKSDAESPAAPVEGAVVVLSPRLQPPTTNLNHRPYYSVYGPERSGERIDLKDDEAKQQQQAPQATPEATQSIWVAPRWQVRLCNADPAAVLDAICENFDAGKHALNRTLQASEVKGRTFFLEFQASGQGPTVKLVQDGETVYYFGDGVAALPPLRQITTVDVPEGYQASLCASDPTGEDALACEDFDPDDPDQMALDAGAAHYLSIERTADDSAKVGGDFLNNNISRQYMVFFKDSPVVRQALTILEKTPNDNTALRSLGFDPRSVLILNAMSGTHKDGLALGLVAVMQVTLHGRQTLLQNQYIERATQDSVNEASALKLRKDAPWQLAFLQRESSPTFNGTPTLYHKSQDYSVSSGATGKSPTGFKLIAWVVDSLVSQGSGEFYNRLTNIDISNSIGGSSDSKEEHGTEVAAILAGRTRGIAPEALIHSVDLNARNGRFSNGGCLVSLDAILRDQSSESSSGMNVKGVANYSNNCFNEGHKLKEQIHIYSKKVYSDYETARAAYYDLVNYSDTYKQIVEKMKSVFNNKIMIIRSAGNGVKSKNGVSIGEELLGVPYGKVIVQGKHKSGTALIFNDNYEHDIRDYMMLIGSVDDNFILSKFSNYGHDVECYTIGERVATVDSKGQPKFFDGTSASAPLVSGYFLNYMEKYPDSSLNAIRLAIKPTKDKIIAGPKIINNWLLYAPALDVGP